VFGKFEERVKLVKREGCARVDRDDQAIKIIEGGD
jgi:hypothetical protein